MKYARVTDGIVVHTLNVPPINIFDPHTASLYQECPVEVEAGWTFDGTTWAAPVPPPLNIWDLIGELYNEQMARAAARRVTFCQDYITANGMPASLTDFRTAIAEPLEIPE